MRFQPKPENRVGEKDRDHLNVSSWILHNHIWLAAALGFLLDAVVGDPHWMPHPVRWVGRLISLLEKGLLREQDPPRRQRWKGVWLVVCVCAVTFATAEAALRLCYRIHPAAGLLVESVLCCYCIAARDLRDASTAVYKPLRRYFEGDEQGNKQELEQARHAVSMIVGRDTSVLDADGIARAAVETVAENTADGVIAPLFWMLVGGGAVGMLYKAVNTMDSMVGYRNEKYQYFGTAAARLDDVVGFLPARLSGLLIILAAFVTGMDGRNAWKIFCRDRYLHASPNSAQSESACAGALDLQLAGDAVYFGMVVHKPRIGDPIREIEPEDILRANRLMSVASVSGLILLCALRILLSVV